MIRSAMDLNSKYEGLEDYEFIDQSGRNLGIDGIFELLTDTEGDKLVKQLNLSYNMSLEDVHNPREVERFFRGLKQRLLKKNQTLTALDLAGNHLFHWFPHPSNEHVKNYVETIYDAVVKSNISHLDLSENNITGNSSRELKGLSVLMNKYMVKNKAFTCRFNNINSQGIKTVSQCLGLYSTVTYLDLSDNQGGVDPRGVQNSEGIAFLASTLMLSMHLRVLKLARNFLSDDDVPLIALQLERLPQFQDLDIAGNLLSIKSCKALQTALISHSTFAESGLHEGFRSLILSNNHLSEDCIVALAVGIERSDTLKTLKLAWCDIVDKDSVKILLKALQKNASITTLDVTNNPMTHRNYTLLMAEQWANCLLCRIKNEGSQSVDTTTLTAPIYTALSRKLRFLPQNVLAELHSNPSFNVAKSDMMRSLHLLRAPERRKLLDNVVQHENLLAIESPPVSLTNRLSPTDLYASPKQNRKAASGKMDSRLLQSVAQSRRLAASSKIYNIVLYWYDTVIRKKKRLRLALEEAKRKQEERSRRNDDDDIYGAKYM
jgi:Ran GTPase-activating protein (RanGAP) involved in mRNA processing and transport